MAFEQTTTVEQKLFDGATVAANILNGKYAISTVGDGDARDEQPGRFYDFDGTNDYILGPTSLITAVENNTVGTISLWVNQDALATNTLFGISDGGDNLSHVRFDIVSDGVLRLRVAEAGITILEAVTIQPVEINIWTHVSVSMGSGGVKIYIDGALQALTFNTGSQSTQEWFNSISNIDIIQIASLTNSSNNNVNNYNGQMFNFKLFDTELTAAQITEIIKFESALATRLHYKCDDTNNTVAYDSSGKSYHGTKTSITPATFHGEGNGVPYSYQNEVGFSNQQNFVEPDSEIITQAGGWLQSSNIVTSQNAKIDPDGGTNAWLIDHTGTTASQSLRMIPQIQSGQTVIYEFWTNSGTFDRCECGFNNAAGFRNFEAEVLEGSATLEFFSVGRLRVSDITEWTKIRLKNTHDADNRILYFYPDASAASDSGSIYFYHPHIYLSGTVDSNYIHTEHGSDVSGNIPRNESLTTLNAITGDVTSSLTYAGQVPRNAQLVESFCGTFDGVDDYIATYTTGDALDISDNLSIFIRATNDNASVAADEVIIAKHDATLDEESWRLFFDSATDKLTLELGDSAGDNQGTWQAGDSVNQDTISSVGFTFDGGTVALYTDGLHATGSLVGGTIPSTLYSSLSAVTIGANLDNGAVAEEWEGILYDARIYDTTILTSGEMLYLHTQGASGDDPGTGNLVAHWPISEGAGEIIYDTINNNNALVLNATTTPGAGFWATTQNEYHHSITKGFDRAYFNDIGGATDYIDCGNGDGELDITGAFSVSIWAQITGDISSARSFIGKYTTVDDNRSWAIAKRSANNGVQLNMTADGIAVATVNNTNHSISDGKWHHIVGTYIPGTNMSIYLDTTVTQKTSSVPVSLHTGVNSVEIGRGLGTHAGRLRDARIYNITLSSDNVLYLYSDGISGTVPVSDPVSHWELNQVSGTNVPDISIFGNDGTVNNALANNENWASELPAKQDGSSSISNNISDSNNSIGLNPVTYTPGLFNGSATNINFIPIASPRTIRVYRGYATIGATSNVIDFNDLDGVTVSSYTVPDGLEDPSGSVSSNQIVFAATGNISNMVLSDGAQLSLYKDSLDYVGTNHGVSSGIVFDTYSLETSYGFGESPVGLTKVEVGLNESSLQYASTIWTLIDPTVIETHPYIFYQIGNHVIQSTPERANGHFTGFSNTILPMTTHSGQFKRDNRYDI